MEVSVDGAAATVRRDGDLRTSRSRNHRESVDRECGAVTDHGIRDGRGGGDGTHAVVDVIRRGQ